MLDLNQSPFENRNIFHKAISGIDCKVADALKKY